MKKFTSELVNKYANDLLFELTEDENKMVLDEFEDIDAAIDKINEIDEIEKLEPMTYALDDFECVLREDTIMDELTIDEVLKNAGASEGREIEVPKVVD